MKAFFNAMLTTTAFALTLGVTAAILGSTAADAASVVDKSEVSGMSCHQGNQNADRCRGWGQ